MRTSRRQRNGVPQKSDYANVNALAVRLYGRQIGIITKLAGERQLFAFEQDYIDDSERPTLSLPLKARRVASSAQHAPSQAACLPFSRICCPRGRCGSIW